MADKNYTTDAINLRSYDLSDADKIVVMYSKDRGIIRSVAKGVKRPKSKLGARMDSLTANTLMFSKGRNLDTVCQAQTINNFKHIRENILKLMLSSYISEIVANFGLECDPSSKETYDLLYSALTKISDSTDKKDILIAVIKFQLKMMLISGIVPEFDTCLCCGKRILEEDMYFSKDRCGVFCSECNNKYHIPLKMHYKIRDFLVAMLQFDFDYESEYDKKATEKICIVCFNLLKDYLSGHSDKKFKSEKILAEVL
ncbi:MAG: DNA repair protein RecO [Candidatus Gastranaerophilales bacterium]|nr:DNA repair protein RecO [Candidatus Gastranaerophilales bacterium]